MRRPQVRGRFCPCPGTPCHGNPAQSRPSLHEGSPRTPRAAHGPSRSPPPSSNLQNICQNSTLPGSRTAGRHVTRGECSGTRRAWAAWGAPESRPAPSPASPHHSPPPASAAATGSQHPPCFSATAPGRGQATRPIARRRRRTRGGHARPSPGCLRLPPHGRWFVVSASLEVPGASA